ncbi:MAG: hypothetical protein CVU55_10025 [Deltaproteobacteria bacterium HGW-Deltaproteobacteria-13]|jgi:hypothetical protein|nr:MAG: hypothetical protein CVU55_10025 [Deltaproteobacteria bacterium HGW-Deltaproteobacteria-13]
MPVIQYLLIHVPTFLLGFILVLFYVFSTIIGLFIIRKFYPYKRCKDHNDIAGFIFATLGVIYAVVLAFTVIVTWEQFDKADDITGREANCIASLNQDSIAFPAEFRARVQGELRDYVNAIIHDEWKTMERGQRSSKVHDLQEKLVRSYSSFQPQNETQKIYLAESVKKLNEASELRRQRVLYASTGLHPILYIILFIGSFITISFTMLFGTENFTEHLIMASLLAAMIAFTLFTIISLDYPFTGKYSIQPEVFIKILPTLLGK